MPSVPTETLAGFFPLIVTPTPVRQPGAVRAPEDVPAESRESAASEDHGASVDRQLPDLPAVDVPAGHDAGVVGPASRSVQGERRSKLVTPRREDPPVKDAAAQGEQTPSPVAEFEASSFPAPHLTTHPERRRTAIKVPQQLASNVRQQFTATPLPQATPKDAPQETTADANVVPVSVPEALPMVRTSAKEEAPLQSAPESRKRAPRPELAPPVRSSAPRAVETVQPSATRGAAFQFADSAPEIDAPRAQVPGVRTATSGLPEIRHLPHLFPQVRGPGDDSRCPQVELVERDPNQDDDRPDCRHVDADP